MTEQTLTAMYDTRGAAESARDQLLGIGVADEAISIRGTDGGTALPDTATEGGGFWAGLADLFMPSEDRHTYAEGLDRGSYLLSARVPDILEAAAADILEASEPVDLDERTASWRQSGWTGYSAGSPSPAGAPVATYGEVVGLAEAVPHPRLERPTPTALSKAMLPARHRSLERTRVRPLILPTRALSRPPRSSCRSASGMSAAAAYGCAAMSPSGRSKSRSSCDRNG